MCGESGEIVEQLDGVETRDLESEKKKLEVKSSQSV